MPNLNPFDAAVMDFVQKFFHNPVTDAVFPILTYLGEYGVIWIFISLVLLFSKKYRKFGFLALMALLLSFLVGEVLIKNIIGRSRPWMDFPDYVLMIPGPSSYSFPSGHSSSSFTAATVFFYMNKKFGICALILAALIAFSRVFLFVHYPSDILAGALLGVFFGVVTVQVYKMIEKKRTKEL